MTRALAMLAVIACCCASRAWADVIVLGGTGTGDLDRIDLTTGTYTTIANNGTLYEGLANGPGGDLYGVNRNSQLVRINPVTGANTVVGATGITVAEFAGLGNGLLYAIGSDDSLYSISATTGAATLVGATGLPTLMKPTTTEYDNSLSGDGTTLYYTLGTNGSGSSNSPEDVLYTLDLTTGQATRIGPTGITSSAGIVGSAFVDGELYGFKSGGSIEIINVNTGEATFTGHTGPVNVFGAVAPVPVPSTIALLGTAGISFAGYRWGRRARVHVTAK